MFYKFFLIRIGDFVADPFLLIAGSIWFIFGLLEILTPRVVRLIFDVLLVRPYILPLIRMGIGLLLIAGSLHNKNHFLFLIVLGFLSEIAGLVAISFSAQQLKVYISWLKRRPKLTLRICGAVNINLAVLILLAALSK